MCGKEGVRVREGMQVWGGVRVQGECGQEGCGREECGKASELEDEYEKEEKETRKNSVE